MAFQLQQWFHEGASISHYTYVASVLSNVICGTDMDKIFGLLRKMLKRTFQTLAD